MRKQQSTNTENLRKLIELCPISYTMSLLGGRWKPLIIDHLLKRPMRYSELKKSIAPITERILTIQLKEMENDGLLRKIRLEERPPKNITYELTGKGLSLKGVLNELFIWGNQYKPLQNQ